MRGDREVTDAGPVGQDHRHGRRVAPVAASGFENVGDGAGAEGIARQRDRDGGREFLRPVVVEEREQSDQMGPQRVAAFGQTGKEGRGDRDGEAQAIARARRIRLPGGGEQAVQMRGILDRGAGVVAAPVPGDRVGPLHDSHGGGAGQQRQRPADVRVGNRVAVAIEPDVRQFAGHDRPHEIRLEGMGRQRQEPRLLLREDLRHRLVALLGMRTLMGDVVSPALKLRVEIVDIAKGAGGKERVAEVADLPLDFAFLIAAGGRAGPDREMVMPGEFEQPRVEADRGPLAFEHGTFQVVVHQGPRGSAEDLEGFDMAA